MRIAQVTCNLECGGSMGMVVALSTELASRGHEVEVLYLDRSTGSDHERLSRSILERNHVPSCSLGRKLGRAGISSAARLWWLVRTKRYDIVHSHLPLADAITGVVMRLGFSECKHVLTVHNTQEPRPRMMAACSSRANVVYCSESALRKNAIAGATSAVIPNGIVQSSCVAPWEQRSKIRRSLGLPDDAVVVIAVGRMCPQKNFDAAIDGMAVLHQSGLDSALRYLFCGDGPEKKRLESRVAALGLGGRVQFLGRRTDIPGLLSASDVFLSTSLFEGMPLAVLEALTASLPCVLSSIDEHYEIARTMPGCVFVTQNAPQDLASALQAFIKRPISQHELRLERTSFLERFTIASCVSAYAQLYTAIQSCGRRTPLSDKRCCG